VQKIIDQRSGMSAIGNMDEFMKYKVALSLENASQNQAGTGEAMGGGLGAGMGLGMGFMMPQMIQQSMASSMQGSSEKETAMDKLKKLKELLDMGVITQDEFNQKKTKLMDQI
jgi:membrane protease subunit (stomatin/prohibitin family)